MGTFIYFVKEAIRGFYQAKLMTFVSIVTIASSLFLMGLIALGLINLQLLLREAGGQADVAVYLRDEPIRNARWVDSLIARVKALPQVKAVTYVDKETAWKRFSRSYGPDILASVDQNPLPASLELSLSEKYNTSQAAASLKKEIEAIPGVDNVQYSKDWMDLLTRFRGYFLAGSIAVALVLLLTLHFMISNTIKLTIYARKELVRNMHYVGATDIFIKMPFIIEGMLQGLAGGLIAVAIVAILKTSLTHFTIYWGFPYLPLLIFTTGVVFGWIGSMFAVRKFLA